MEKRCGNNSGWKTVVEKNNAYFVQNLHPKWPMLCSAGICIVQKQLPASSCACLSKVDSLLDYVNFGDINLNLHKCKDM